MPPRFRLGSFVSGGSVSSSIAPRPAANYRAFPAGPRSFGSFPPPRPSVPLLARTFSSTPVWNNLSCSPKTLFSSGRGGSRGTAGLPSRTVSLLATRAAMTPALVAAQQHRSYTMIREGGRDKPPEDMSKLVLRICKMAWPEDPALKRSLIGSIGALGVGKLLQVAAPQALGSLVDTSQEFYSPFYPSPHHTSKGIKFIHLRRESLGDLCALVCGEQMWVDYEGRV